MLKKLFRRHSAGVPSKHSVSILAQNAQPPVYNSQSNTKPFNKSRSFESEYEPPVSCNLRLNCIHDSQLIIAINGQPTPTQLLDIAMQIKLTKPTEILLYIGMAGMIDIGSGAAMAIIEFLKDFKGVILTYAGCMMSLPMFMVWLVGTRRYTLPTTQWMLSNCNHNDNISDHTECIDWIESHKITYGNLVSDAESTIRILISPL